MKNGPAVTGLWLLALLFLLGLLFMPTFGLLLGPMGFLLIMAIGLFILLGLMQPGRSEREEATPPTVDDAGYDDPVLDAAVRQVLAISGKTAQQGTLVFEGRLRSGPAEEALAQLRSSLTGSNRELILQDAAAGKVRILVLPPGAVPAASPARSRPLLNVGLFLLTLATTTFTGAAHQGVDLLREPNRFMVGLPYSLALLLILGAHELGHYFVARRYRMNVSLPYFIPVPFGLGTFGAFIRLRALAPDRKSLFDMALAGPLAGLVFAIPALLIGLPLSRIVPMSNGSDLFGGNLDVGSSLLLTLLAKLSIGGALSEGHTLLLHPLAYAGWLGLLVTALNLLPIGQLDGGHIAHAAFGPAGAHRLSILASGALLALALFVWPGLLLFAILVLFLAGGHDAPSANDATALSPGRKWLGYAAFALLLLILLPVPHRLFPELGIRCPYL